MSIFTGAPNKSRVGTKSDVVHCGNRCLSYNANNGSSLSARCRRGSARHQWPNDTRRAVSTKCVMPASSRRRTLTHRALQPTGDDLTSDHIKQSNGRAVHAGTTTTSLMSWVRCCRPRTSSVCCGTIMPGASVTWTWKTASCATWTRTTSGRSARPRLLASGGIDCTMPSALPPALSSKLLRAEQQCRPPC
jgi:hypothetical protein